MIFRGPIQRSPDGTSMLNGMKILFSYRKYFLLDGPLSKIYGMRPKRPAISKAWKFVSWIASTRSSKIAEIIKSLSKTNREKKAPSEFHPVCFVCNIKIHKPTQSNITNSIRGIPTIYLIYGKMFKSILLNWHFFCEHFSPKYY